MMWQSESIRRLRSSHAFPSVTDERPSCCVSAQSTNKAPGLFAPPSPPTLHSQREGLESSSLTNGLHKPHSSSSECITPPCCLPSPQSMHGLPLKSPFQAPHNCYLIGNRINCNWFFKAQSIWDNVQKHQGKRSLQQGAAGEVDTYLFTEGI